MIERDLQRSFSLSRLIAIPIKNVFAILTNTQVPVGGKAKQVGSVSSSGASSLLSGCLQLYAIEVR